MAEEKKTKQTKAATEKKIGSVTEKNGIKYYKITSSCACGAEFDTGSTKDKIRVDICSKCHPFFTGEQRLLDTEGRVDKFRKKYNLK
jgi:large subunit ribosomal protein L31